MVLSRKNRESVVVGDSERMLKITVLEICGAPVKLGFEVAEEIPVYRWKVWERMIGRRRLENPVDGPAAPAR